MTRTMTLPCPLCPHQHPFTATVMHDAGRWMTANGDGWPESWEVDFDEAQCPTYAEHLVGRVEDAFITAFQESRDE